MLAGAGLRVQTQASTTAVSNTMTIAAVTVDSTANTMTVGLLVDLVSDDMLVPRVSLLELEGVGVTKCTA